MRHMPKNQKNRERKNGLTYIPSAISNQPTDNKGYNGYKALPNIRAESVADKIVNNWCYTFSIPESILTDGDKQYQSKLLDLVYEYLDIRGLKITPFNPRCNGLSERSVQTSKNVINANIDDEQSDWDMILPKSTHAYNTSVQESTKQTPFEIMFGRKPKLPIDKALQNAELTRKEVETWNIVR